jgi:hypothetical protein
MKKAHQHLIKWGLKQGYTIEVNCDGERDYYGTDYNEAIEAIEATEHGTILLVDSSTKNKPINYHAGFCFVFEYDQQPDEIIYDYDVNEVSTAWDQDYTAHCKKYPINKHFSRSNN